MMQRLKSYINDGAGMEITPGEVSKRRAIADAMMKRTRTPQNVGEGIDAASRNIMGALLARRMGSVDYAQDQAAGVAGSYGDVGEAEGDALFGDLFGGGGGAGGGMAGGAAPMYGDATLNPAITGPVTSYDALVMGGGPTNDAAAVLDIYGQPSVDQRNAALANGGGPTRAAAESMRMSQLPPMSRMPKWY